MNWDDAFALIAIPAAFLIGFIAAMYDIDKPLKKREDSEQEAESDEEL